MTSVILEGGPLAANPNAHVEQREGGGWPGEVLLTSGPNPDDRHLYRFVTVGNGNMGPMPVYRYDRTLASDEEDPTAT